MKKIIIALLAVVCSQYATAQVYMGMTAPEISLPDANDSIIHLSSFKGKVVLIDFWASWCGPCRQSIPAVKKLYNKFNKQGFEVLGISIDNKKPAWLKAVKHDKINYTQMIDKEGWNSGVAGQYGVNEIPTTFLLDKSGKIVAIDLEGKDLEEAIIQLLQ